METKEYNLPLDEAVETPAETPALPRTRKSARKRAAFDAVTLFIQQALLCTAIAAGCTRTGLALTTALYLAVTAAVAVLDFFFGGFISGRWRIAVRTAACTLGYAAIALIFYPVSAVGITVVLSVLTFAALFAVNAHLESSYDRENSRYLLMRILSALIIAAAVAGFGPVL